MSCFQDYNPTTTLYDGLSRLSHWPDEPHRAWIHSGCQTSVIEIWQYQDTLEGYFSHQVLKAKNASEILNANPRLHNRKEPIAGVKILVIEGCVDSLDPGADTCDLSAERSMMEQAFDAFGLSSATGALFSLECNAPSSGELLQLQATTEDRSSTKYMDFPYQCLAWTSNLKGNFTYAVFRSDIATLESGQRLAISIQRYTCRMSLPSLLPYLACHMAVDYNGEMLRDALNEIRVVEAQSGFHTWKETENYLKTLKLGAELSALSKLASGVAAGACSRKTDAQHLQLATQSLIKAHITDMERYCPDRSMQDGLRREIYECLTILEGVTRSQRSFAEEIHQRALIQQSAVFQFTAQRDQALNLEVAKHSRIIALQSKRDTLSMETIAFLTMLILPGGFTAVSLIIPEI